MWEYMLAVWIGGAILNRLFPAKTGSGKVARTVLLLGTGAATAAAALADPRTETWVHRRIYESNVKKLGQKEADEIQQSVDYARRTYAERMAGIAPPPFSGR
jgi:hypothetical protein